MADGDGEPAGSCLRQTPASRRPRRRRRAPASCSHAAPTQPVSHSAARSASAAPSRQGLGRTRTSAPSPRNPSTAAATASGPSRRPPAVMRRWCASNAAATRESSGSAGASSTRPTTDSVQQHRTSGSGADVDQRRQLVAGHQVEQRRGGDEGRAGEIVRPQPGDVGPPRLDGDGSAVGGRAGQVGRGDLQQVRVPVVQDPALRPRQERREPAAHRPGAAGEVVDHPAGRPGGRRRRRCVDELAGAGRGVGSLAQVEPVRS